MNTPTTRVVRAVAETKPHRPLCNAALWKLAVLESRTMLLACSGLMFAFHWLFVWLTSQIELGPLSVLAQMIPPAWQKLLPVPIGVIATNVGMVSMAYVEPIVVIVMLVWSVGRGSDAVSGPLDRGTLEMLLAQPIRRGEWYATGAVVTIAGAAVIAASCWIGTCVGLYLVPFPEEISPLWYLPAAANVLALTVFLSGTASAISALHRYRWQTIGWMGALFAATVIIKAIALMAPQAGALIYLSFLGAYEPVLLVTDADPWQISLRYCGILLLLGSLAYVAGGFLFCRRDLPPPV